MTLVKKYVQYYCLQRPADGLPPLCARTSVCTVTIRVGFGNWRAKTETTDRVITLSSNNDVPQYTAGQAVIKSTPKWNMSCGIEVMLVMCIVPWPKVDWIDSVQQNGNDTSKPFNQQLLFEMLWPIGKTYSFELEISRTPFFIFFLYSTVCHP